MKMIRAMVITAAWVFVGGTFLTLVLVIIAGLWHPGSVSRVWASGMNGQDPVVHLYQMPAAQTVDPPGLASAGGEDLREAIGLTYRGYAGVLLAAIQLLCVAGCAVLAVRGRGIQLRGAHLLLSIWAALWLGNATWMWLTTPTTVAMVFAGIVVVLFACTVLRAWLSWNSSRADHAAAH